MAGFSVKREINGFFPTTFITDQHENILFQDVFTSNESLKQLHLSYPNCFRQSLVTYN